MDIQIVGDFDKDQIICTGSQTKQLTTLVCLSHLAEKFSLPQIIDDDHFFDNYITQPQAKTFLQLFQKLIGGKFTIHDLCSYYSGLPYTFDLAQDELAAVEAGQPFKHHSISDETTFLARCHECITPVYSDRCKFHYSEIAIIFLAYLIEKNDDVTMEALYQKYIIQKFQLHSSYFSRTRVPGVYVQDLSPAYDYPSIAILDHGYFCYSNGFYTTLNDLKKLLEHLLLTPVFQLMSDMKIARAASNRLLNGMAVEIRLHGDDVIYGYEGLSFSGCVIWAYSTKKQQGFVHFDNSEEDAYKIYDRWGYEEFDKVPEYTQKDYAAFLKRYDFNSEQRDVPLEYQGEYHRVNINDSILDSVFHLGKRDMVIRNPDEIKYDLMFANGHYCVKGKDGVHGASVGLYTANSGNHYFIYDGTLYKKINDHI